MKIKFYPLKRNGEIAKTPVYTDTLTKEFCCYNLLDADYENYQYSYSENKSLYEVYLELIKVCDELDVTDQMFIEKTPITAEKMRAVLISKTVYFEAYDIIPKVNEYKKRMDELAYLHKENVNNIHYCAFDMEKNVGEYESLFKKVTNLKKGKLIYLENPEQDNENYHHYVNIIDDIQPVTPEELLV